MFPKKQPVATGCSLCREIHCECENAIGLLAAALQAEVVCL